MKSKSKGNEKSDRKPSQAKLKAKFLREVVSLLESSNCKVTVCVLGRKSANKWSKLKGL